MWWILGLGCPGSDSSDVCNKYTDADNDGFGTGPKTACSGVVFDGDCDDAASNIAPGQSEDPEDGVDSDCDGTVERVVPKYTRDNADADILLATSMFPQRLRAGDADLDGQDELLIESGYGFYLAYGGPELSGEVDAATLVANGYIDGVAATRYTADAVVTDVDGDGTPGFVVASRDAGSGAYAIETFDGGRWTEAFPESEPLFTTPSALAALQSLGDLDGDGTGDVYIVSAPPAILYGKMGGWDEITWDDTTKIQLEVQCGSETGRSGDLDGDGDRDLVIYEPCSTDFGRTMGSVYVAYGEGYQWGGTIVDGVLSFAIDHPVGDFTSSFAGSGDIFDYDDDGYDDIGGALTTMSEAGTQGGAFLAWRGAAVRRLDDIDTSAPDLTLAHDDLPGFGVTSALTEKGLVLGSYDGAVLFDRARLSGSVDTSAPDARFTSPFGSFSTTGAQYGFNVVQGLFDGDASEDLAVIGFSSSGESAALVFDLGSL